MTASRPAQPDPTDPRPNIVVVYADDLGWCDVSTGRTNRDTASPFFETPAVARLAREGMAFDNAYMSPNCAPSRAALLTGQYPTRPTNDVYLVGHLNRGGDDTMLVGPQQGRLAGGRDAIPAASTTYAEVLGGAGYVTGYIGKFHVTLSGAAVTADHGFDENWGGDHHGTPGVYHATAEAFSDHIGPELARYAGRYTQAYVDTRIKPFSTGVPDAVIDSLVGSEKHVTDALTDATIDFVDRHAARPFLAFLSDYAVHTPVNPDQARADLLTKYRAKPPAEGRPCDPAYAALVEGLDQGIARLLRHLEETADPRHPGHTLAENTIVIVTSDNGGLGRYADNGPLRGQKGELYEGGIRVPFVAWSANPDLVGNGINSTPIHAIDLFPTFAAIAGVDTGTLDVDGCDLGSLFRDADASLERDGLYWHLPGYLVDPAGNGRDQRPQTVLRAGRWKISYSYETTGWQLYDVERDIAETVDLAGEVPEITARLGRQLIEWLAATRAPLARLREGRSPVSITLDGIAYADGEVTRHDGELVVMPGEEMPIVLPHR